MSKLPDAKPFDNETNAGSPSSGEPVFLAVGQLRRPHGLNGEMVMTILTDFPRRLHKGKVVYVGEKHEQMTIAATRLHTKDLLITMDGCDSADLAARLRNKVIYVKADSLPELPEGEYYHHQLIGMKVVDESGQNIGVLNEILETGANDVYIVQTPDGDEILLPALEDVILEVDPTAGRMRVKPPIWS